MALLWTSGVLGVVISPAESVLLEAIHSIEATATASASAPPATNMPEQQDSNNCDPSMEHCGQSSNAPSCTSALDCNAYCDRIMGNGPDVVQTNCVGNYDPSHPNEPIVDKLCTCSNGTIIADVATSALIGIGEVGCFVLDEAVPLSADALKVLGRLTKVQALKWAGKILKYGDHYLAQGSKLGKCDNVGCPGHQFVVVDPADMMETLGPLNVC